MLWCQTTIDPDSTSVWNDAEAFPTIDACYINSRSQTKIIDVSISFGIEKLIDKVSLMTPLICSWHITLGAQASILREVLCCL
jgi:hypothetical protein